MRYKTPLKLSKTAVYSFSINQVSYTERNELMKKNLILSSLLIILAVLFCGQNASFHKYIFLDLLKLSSYDN